MIDDGGVDLSKFLDGKQDTPGQKKKNLIKALSVGSERSLDWIQSVRV